MINSLVDIIRFAGGAKLTYEFLAPDTLDGIEHPDPQYQEFVDTLCKTANVTNKVIVREVDYWEDGCIRAASTLCKWSGLGQVLLPKSTPWPKDELKVIIGHELGHISGSHPVLAEVFLATNAILLAIPSVPLSTVLATWTFSVMSLVPLYMWAEREADAFALQYCPLDVLKGSLEAEKSRDSTRKPQIGWKADLLEFFVFRSKERRKVLEKRIEELT